jgi:hypothetical protein
VQVDDFGDILDAGGRFANAARPYDLTTGDGTYFASITLSFFSRVLGPPREPSRCTMRRASPARERACV